MSEKCLWQVCCKICIMVNFLMPVLNTIYISGVFVCAKNYEAHNLSESYKSMFLLSGAHNNTLGKI
jgi:hypothetical protein